MEGSMDQTGIAGYVLMALAVVVSGLMLLAVIGPAVERLVEAERMLAVKQSSNHAVVAHGADATLVQQACDERGPTMKFKEWRAESQQFVEHWLCELPDGRIGDRIVAHWANGDVYEVTAFIPKGGVMQRILRWLMNKGATVVE